MKQTHLYAPTLKENAAEAEINSHQLLLRAGFIRQLASGVYTYLPLGMKVLHKIQIIIREQLNGIGFQELMMPAIQPAELWQSSGRFDLYGSELIRFNDRQNRAFVLGPTHEEIITSLIKNDLNTYKKLPVRLYQIQTKFRDERRPRYGLLRTREFIMKDGYSFESSHAELNVTYKAAHDAYQHIFSQCGLTVMAVEADSGSIGGDGGSHEFIAPAAAGEDTIVTCPSCQYAANIEVNSITQQEKQSTCPVCHKAYLQFITGIEVGHIFKLGTKYSEPFQASFYNQTGESQPIIMGCYGIGISRLLAAVVEQHNDAKGIIWPKELSPFLIHIVIAAVHDTVQYNAANQIYNALRSEGLDTLMDDRKERFGVKLNDADLIGIPYRIIVGQKIASGFVEIQCRRTGNIEFIAEDKLISYFISKNN